jgi:hypothetical protein
VERDGLRGAVRSGREGMSTFKDWGATPVCEEHSESPNSR